MAATLAVTRPNGSRSEYTSGGRRHRVRLLTWSGTYAAGGNTINASDVDLKEIEEVKLHGHVAVGSTPATGNPVSVVYASDNQSVTLRLHELGGTGAAGDPLGEKGAEAVITGQNIRATFVGH